MFSSMQTGIMQILNVLLILSICYNLALSEKCGTLKPDDNLQHPSWNVGIFIERNNNLLDFICFGSIIKPNTILTTAHCFCENLSAKLRNDTFYYTTDPVYYPTIRKTSNNLIKIEKDQIEVHPNFQGIIDFNAADLAIIKLKEPLKNEPVCIDWTKTELIASEDQTGKIPGWTVHLVIKLFDLQEIDFDSCKANSSAKYNPFVNNDKKCTQNIENAKSEGDNSGAAVIIQHKNQWYLNGVKSSEDLQTNLYPVSANVNINHYLNWLSNMNAKL